MRTHDVALDPGDTSLLSGASGNRELAVNQSLQSAAAEWSDNLDGGGRQPVLVGGLPPADALTATLTASAISVVPAADSLLAKALANPARLGVRWTGRTRWRTVARQRHVLGTKQ